MTFSIYKILTASYNSDVIKDLNNFRGSCKYFEDKVFTSKIDENGTIVNYNIQLNLEDWNFLKHKLNYQPKKHSHDQDIYPLYKFGFQNVIEDQFSHEAYNFMTDQNGYTSITLNSSYV